LKAGLWVRLVRFVMFAPDPRQHCRRQAENLPIGLSEFPRPPLTSTLHLPLHANLGVVAQRRRGVLRQADQAAPEARCLPFACRLTGRHQTLPSRGQRPPQTLPMGQGPGQNHRRCQARAPSVRFAPLANQPPDASSPGARRPAPGAPGRRWRHCPRSTPRRAAGGRVIRWTVHRARVVHCRARPARRRDGSPVSVSGMYDYVSSRR